MTQRVLMLPGDGVGPEVMGQARRILEFCIADSGIDLRIDDDIIGGQAWDELGTFCAEATVKAAKSSVGVLCGAVGGPEYDHLVPVGTPEEKDGLMRLRRELDVFAGIRPAAAVAHLADRTPYRSDVIAGVDVVVLREMCGGVMFAPPRGIRRTGSSRYGFDTAAYDDVEIARHARAGFDLARTRRSHLTSVDKSNVMESGLLWREVVDEVAVEFPDVELEHLYTDNCSYQIAVNPARFDVILADNLFGDILSDQAGALVGSLGMLASACLPGLDPENGPGIYEPVHGSAPDIAGQGIANPIGMILSVALFLRYGLERDDLSQRVEAAVFDATTGTRTRDLGGSATTAEMTDAVLRCLEVGNGDEAMSS